MVPIHIKVLAPRPGHWETGVCVCRNCHTNMRLVGIEPDPRWDFHVNLFTYECVCGMLHTDAIRLQNLVGSACLNIEVKSQE